MLAHRSDLQFPCGPIYERTLACHSWQDFLLRCDIWLTTPKSRTTPSPIVPKGTNRTPLPKQVLLAHMMGTTRRIERQVCLTTAHAARTLRTITRAMTRKRLKPAAALIRPTGPHKRPAAPGSGCSINPRLCIQNPIKGNNYCSTSRSMVPTRRGILWSVPSRQTNALYPSTKIYLYQV